MSIRWNILVIKVLYNILLEKHDQMMVHNNLIIVETLHPPDNTIAKLAVLTKNISDEEQVSAVKTFNELVFGILKNFFSKQNTKSE